MMVTGMQVVMGGGCILKVRLGSLHPGWMWGVRGGESATFARGPARFLKEPVMGHLEASSLSLSQAELHTRCGDVPGAVCPSHTALPDPGPLPVQV